MYVIIARFTAILENFLDKTYGIGIINLPNYKQDNQVSRKAGKNLSLKKN